MMRLLLLFVIFGTTYTKAQKNLSLLAHLSFTYRCSNIWTYSQDDYEYALLGTAHGMQIFDITMPASLYEIAHIPGATSIWREIKTYNHFAYVTTEGGGGITIVDMNNLPTSVAYWNYTGTTEIPIDRVHTLHIEDGYCYLYGANYGNGGVIILDIHTDPYHPSIVGVYNTHYVHDGYVRGDYIYASEMYEGTLSIIDISNKATPTLITSIATPNHFTHNSWLSDDSNICYTTDERSAAYVTSYDVSDLDNIEELDRWQDSTDAMSMPHNVHFLNNYLIVSYYKSGIYIVDAHKSDNLVTIGYYDTTPSESGAGASGVWGANGFLPSGHIVVSDIFEGLFVLAPNYTRACYLEGNIYNAATDDALIGAKVKILAPLTLTEITNIAGEYKTGTADSGYYDIQITHPDCDTTILENIFLHKAITTTLNIHLKCSTVGIDEYPSALTVVSIGKNIFLVQSEYEIENIELINTYGQIITTEISNTINGNNYPAGTYFIRIHTQNGFYTKQIVIS